MSRLSATWRRRPLLTTVFGLALALTLFFAIRAVAFLIYWSDPAQRDQRIEGWMTPRYVVKSWRLPPEVMIEALGEGPMPGKRRTLADIATDQGITLEELAARIALAAQDHRDGAE